MLVSLPPGFLLEQKLLAVRTPEGCDTEADVVRRWIAVPVLLAASACVCSPLCASSALLSQAQTAAAKSALEGTWQGTLQVGKGLRTVVKISMGADGALKSEFYSIDQGSQKIGVKSTTLQDGNVRLDVENIGGTYTGKLSPDGNTITGNWLQGDKPLPLVLVRATTETAWAIPEPPKPVAPMAKDAKPNWDVATIKPAPPDEKGKGFGGPPRHFRTGNTTLNDLISFAYEVSPKQVVGGPSWMETDKFDITTGEPDVPGAPNFVQMKAMLRRLLEQRFGLKFHSDKREMSAYVLTVAKGGPKLTKSQGDHQAGAFYFPGKLGNLVFRDDTMDIFCSGLQGSVFDRPVVNRTGLEGNWDGALKWTPDESQFTAFNMKIVPDESPDAPPPFFTAIQEQLGLKLDAEKTAVDVMVLDHVEKPSEN